MTKRWLKHPWYAFSSGIICKICNRISLEGDDKRTGCVRNNESAMPSNKVKYKWRVPI